jgi:hypothetical protein
MVVHRGRKRLLPLAEASSLMSTLALVMHAARAPVRFLWMTPAVALATWASHDSPGRHAGAAARCFSSHDSDRPHRRSERRHLPGEASRRDTLITLNVLPAAGYADGNCDCTFFPTRLGCPELV